MEMIREAEDLYRDTRGGVRPDTGHAVRGPAAPVALLLVAAAEHARRRRRGRDGRALDAILNLREAACRASARARRTPTRPRPRPRRRRRRPARPSPGPRPTLRLHKTTSPPPKRARTHRLRPPLCRAALSPSGAPVLSSVTQLRHPTRGCHCFFARAGLPERGCVAVLAIRWIASASDLQASLRLPIGRVLSWTPETTNTATRRRCAMLKRKRTARRLRGISWRQKTT